MPEHSGPGSKPIEGRTLADRLKAGALPIDEALYVADQLAAALEAAHDGGTVHRALMPSIVMLAPDGKATILEGPAPTPEASYMSPEQARGRPVDKRSDIWSLGCVLYECLTGRRAFEGGTPTEVLLNVVERDPSWDTLPRRTPPRVQELVARCLEKDPRRRIRDAGDVRIEIERAREAREWTSSGALRAVRGTRFPLSWIVAALASAAAVAAIVFAMASGSRFAGSSAETARPKSAPPALRVDVTDPDAPRFPGADVPSLAISADGALTAYICVAPSGGSFDSQICVRRADEVHVMQRVSYPEPGMGVADPFFSPDGKWLGFTSKGLYKVPLAGGRSIALVENRTVGGMKGAVWTDRGIIYSPTAKAGLFLVGDNGGTPQRLTTPDASKGEVSHRWPSLLPDGRHLLFTIKKEGIASFDQAEIALLDLDAKTWTTLIQGGSFAQYLPSGRIVYARAGSIAAVPFDLGAMKVTGPPVTVLTNVVTEPGSGAAQFAVGAGAGQLLYVPGGPNISRQELVWVDRRGAVTPVGAPLEPYFDPKLSRDGTKIAATVFGATDTVVVYDIAHGSSMKTQTAGNATVLAWHPDGRQLLISSDAEGGGVQHLYLTAADGTGKPHRLATDVAGGDAGFLVGTPDGLGLVHHGEGGLYFSRIDGHQQPQRITAPGDVSATQPAVSPDGRWLAYNADVGGRRELFVRPFPTGNGVWQLSRDGGTAPHWSPRGDEIVFERDNGATDRWLLSVHVAASAGSISASPPVELFRIPSDLAPCEFHPDGQRLLARRSVPPQYPGDRVIEIVNWAEQVKARMPAK